MNAHSNTQPVQHDRARRSPRLRAGAMLALLVVSIIGMATGTSPPRGSDAPPIRLKDLDGAVVETTKLAPRPLVLVFGELTNENTKTACADVLNVLADPRLAGEGAMPILIVAQDASRSQLKDEAALARFPAVILHDPTREAFGAYRILVLPTIVVVNPKGKVVHASPGFTPRFKELLAEAVLVATGKEPDAQFERSLDPKSQSSTPEVVRADRLVHLGVELTRHALYDMAEARFADALRLVPAHRPAKLGLAELMLRQDRLDDAEPVFTSLLASEPDSADAALGLAAIQIKRAGDHLAKAEAGVRAVLAKSGSNARAHYLLGQIHEARAESPQAAAEYRKAAELLLDR